MIICCICMYLSHVSLRHCTLLQHPSRGLLWYICKYAWLTIWKNHAFFQHIIWPIWGLRYILGLLAFSCNKFQHIHVFIKGLSQLLCRYVYKLPLKKFKKKTQIFLYSRFSLVHSFGFFSLLTTFKDMSVSGYVTPPILCNVGDQGRTW